MAPWHYIAIALTLILAGVASAQDADNLYVAKNGDDSWSGRLAAPNKARTDGPLATMKGARDTIRRIKSDQNGLARPIIVSLRAGTYYLNETLELTGQDSGASTAPITWQAYADSKGVERVTISGGRPIKGFAPVTINGKNLIAADSPEVRRGDWNPDQLFINGRRAHKTRLPKEGYYYIKAAPIGGKWQDGQDQFEFNDGEINANWRNLGDVEVRTFNLWVDSRLPVKSVDETTHTVQFTKPSRFWLAREHNRKLFARYIVENVFEALDSPGQWYLDRSEGKFYYYPAPKQDLSSSEFVAPVLETIIRLAGQEDQPVQFVRFKNLQFSHTQYALPQGSSGSAQAAHEVPAAITAQHARNCDISYCEISGIGNYAVDFGQGCSHCAVRSSLIKDLGAGGVKIQAGSTYTTVSNNKIIDGGKIFASGIGVWIAGSPNNRVTNNEIGELNYTGVSVGWSWGYDKSAAVNNLVANNRIHHIGRGVLSDLGGIYTLGVSPGTILRNNFIHDCESAGYGGWGIYTDEGSTDILIENNIVSRTKTGGFHQHYGKDNIVTNNIFAFATLYQLQKTRAEEHRGFTFERNIIFYKEGALMSGNWGDDNYEMDHNLYFNTSGQPITFGDANLEQWQARGHDRHSIIADPLFRHPNENDFRMKPNSPAVDIGFRQIDLSKNGPMTIVGIQTTQK